MRTLRIVIWIGVLAGIACLPVSLHAQETEIRDLARVIAPFVDEQTVGLVHVDMAMFDFTESVDVLAEFFHLSDRDRGQLHVIAAPVSVFAQGFSPDAHADLFVVISIADLANMPFFVVMPLEGQTAAPAIATELRRDLARRADFEVVTEEIEGSLVTGSKRTVERLKKGAAVERPEIRAAFSAAGESAVQFLIVPSANARRAIELLMPKLPAELGGGPTQQITRHVKWVAAGLNLPPGDTSLRVIVEAENAESAEKLTAATTALVKSLERDTAPSESIPDVGKLTAHLVPQAEGASIVFEVVPESDEVAQYGALLTPLLKIPASIKLP